MILVFALWALEGYSYPSNPIAFALNAVSKVLAFVTVGSLFVNIYKKSGVISGNQLNGTKRVKN